MDLTVQDLHFFCHNFKIPRFSRQQASKNKININDRKPGDLLFFACEKDKNYITHTVIYIGNDVFIEAPFQGLKVRKNKFNKYYCGGKIVRASRYWK